MINIERIQDSIRELDPITAEGIKAITNGAEIPPGLSAWIAGVVASHAVSNKRGLQWVIDVLFEVGIDSESNKEKVVRVMRGKQ